MNLSLYNVLRANLLKVSYLGLVCLICSCSEQQTARPNDAQEQLELLKQYNQHLGQKSSALDQVKSNIREETVIYHMAENLDNPLIARQIIGLNNIYFYINKDDVIIAIHLKDLDPYANEKFSNYVNTMDMKNGEGK